MYIWISSYLYGWKKAIDYAKDNNYDIKVETHGYKGIVNKITKKDLDTAEGVIIAVDKPLDLSHIQHKNIIKIRTIDLIKNPEKYFNQIVTQQTKKTKKEKVQNFFNITAYQKLFFGSSQGWNYLSWASLIVGIIIYIGSVNKNIYNSLDMQHLISFFRWGALLAPCLFTSYLVYSFSKNSKSIFFISLFITTGLSFYAKQGTNTASSIGIIGCVIISLLIYCYWVIINWITPKINNKFILKKQFIWLSEVVVYAGITIIALFWLVTPLSNANNAIYTWWNNTNEKYWWFRWLIAFIFFELMIFDLGGTLNKWALVFSAILFLDSFAWNPENSLLTPMTATSLAIPIPCLALGLWGEILKPKLPIHLQKEAKIALKGHFQGISEPALFAIEYYHWKGYLANIFISIVGSFLIAIFNLKFWGGFNNLWGIIFSFSTTGNSIINLPFGNIAYAITEIGTILIGTVIYLVLLNPINKKNNK